MSQSVDLTNLLNKLTICDITKDYGKLIEILQELSLIEFEISYSDLDLIDNCLKNSISQKRKKFNLLEFKLSTFDSSKSNPNTKVLEVEEERIKELSFSTRNIIKNIVVRDGKSHSKELRLDEDLNNQSHVNHKILLKTIIKDYRKLLLELYDSSIDIFKNFLLKLTNKENEKVRLFFIKTIADYKRYKFEITLEMNDKLETEKAYEEGKILAINLKKKKNDENLYHKFYLNYGVFLHDIIEKKQEAIEVTKKFLEETFAEHDEIKSNEQKDIVLIWQIMKDNLALWIQEDGFDVKELLNTYTNNN